MPGTVIGEVAGGGVTLGPGWLMGAVAGRVTGAVAGGWPSLAKIGCATKLTVATDTPATKLEMTSDFLTSFIVQLN